MNQAVVRSTKKKSAVLLVSGFLGAGKTTLLKRILQWEADLADTVVLVNEFGDVGIDGELLKNAGSDVVELASGCICCTLSADLKLCLTSIWEQFKPKRTFIEASGVADPAAIVDVLMDASFAETMILEKIVTVLDADMWEGRDYFGRLFFNQLEMAHLILLNKVDLVDEKAIPCYLKEIHDVIPNCKVVPTIRCGIDRATLWHPPTSPNGIFQAMHPSRQAATEDGAGVHGPDFDQHRSHGESTRADKFVTFTFEEPQIMDKSRFNRFMEALPLEVFRMKGPVRFVDRTELINFVGGKGEWSPWNGASETRLAFIGWKVRPEEILEKVRRCTLQAHGKK